MWSLIGSTTCFLLADSEADPGKLLASVRELFYRLMNAPLKCYYFFGVKMTSSYLCLI